MELRDRQRERRRNCRWNEKYPLEYYFLDEVSTGSEDESAPQSEQETEDQRLKRRYEKLEKQIDSVDSLMLVCVMIDEVAHFLGEEESKKTERAVLFTEATRKACMYYSHELRRPFLKFLTDYYDSVSPPPTTLDNVASKLIEIVLAHTPLRISANEASQETAVILALVTEYESNSSAIKEFIRREACIENQKVAVIE
eukprot:TRINITY_DN10281_c0_g1_i1.p1 TRINITY_DN10281_c0_g1~~TRINITY_DN10281_c0_g1_i1.p1  ORF type:complete len:217 (+),score=41.09 TRINITY_DN10281_c0_g1_i1:59-652(+)